MTDWFRSWHGAPTDHKWLVVARRAGTVPGIVSAVVWALFDHASQQVDRGDVQTFDVETYAAASGFEEDLIHKIIASLTDKGIIADYRLTAWEKRQPKREDDSAARVALHRERNAEKRDVTQRNAPEKSREDTETEKNISVHRTEPDTDPFDEFWGAFPKREGANPRKPARLAFARAVKRGGAPAAIIEGAKRLASKHPASTPFVPQAVTWLNQDRWLDAEATGPPAEVKKFQTVDEIIAERKAGRG